MTSFEIIMRMRVQVRLGITLPPDQRLGTRLSMSVNEWEYTSNQIVALDSNEVGQSIM